MPSFTQNDKLSVAFGALGQNDLLLESFTGVERISGLFQFELQMLAEKETMISFSKIIGQPVSVHLADANRNLRYVHGIVSKLTEGGYVRASGGRQTLIRYRAVMVPAVYKLKKHRHSRIFQDVSIKTILQTVFKGFDTDMQGVAETFPPRNYCVQYEESDFAFASRLMEQEGIYYYFKHSETGHQMVFTSGTPTTSPVQASYDPEEDTKHGERIYQLDKMQELTSGSFTVWDYHFQAAKANLNATVTVSSPVAVGQVNHPFDIGGNSDLEDYRHGDYAHHFDAINEQGAQNSQGLAQLHDKNTNRATLRMERTLAKALTLSGESNCPKFGDGVLVDVQNHFRGTTKLMLTEVRHQASVEGAFTTRSDTPFTYSNQFKAIPAGLQYRPPCKTSKPKIMGCQTAMVIGADSTDLSTDPFGRVQVQFYWDCWGNSSSTLADGNASPGYQFWEQRREGAVSNSCWLRVSQAWAGPGFGTLFTPRKGMEVVISFLDGDPDRPVIVGCTYNSLNTPPFQLPQDAAATGWKSNSLGGDETNFNGLAFVDTKGEEKVYLQSEGNLIIRTEGDLIFDVGGKVLTNHSGNHRHTIGNIPGMNGSGSGGGSTAFPVVMNTTEVVTTGSGSGGDSQAGSFTAWAMTGTGAGWADEYQATWGSFMRTTVGMNGAISIPLKYDIVFDPISMLGFGVSVTQFTTLASSMLTGNRKIYLSNTSEFSTGIQAVVLLEKKNAMELAGEQQPDKAFIKSALRTFSIVLGMLVVTEVTAMGIANDLVNSEKMTIADDVMAAAIIAECVALEGIVMACSISLARIADAAVAAPSIAEQIATAKQAAVEAAGKNADLQVKELKDLIIDTQNATAQDLDAITGSIKREINNALTQITTGADIVFNMTSSATMQCNAVIAKTSSYVSVLPAETSIGYACEDPLAPTEVAVSACKVRLSVGPLAPAEGTASITITSAGITLLVGVPGTGSSIEMTPEGIVINSPKISITSEGGVNIISPTKVTGVVSITGDMSISGAASISTNLDVTASLTVNGGTSLLGALTVVGPEVNLVP